MKYSKQIWFGAIVTAITFSIVGYARERKVAAYGKSYEGPAYHSGSSGGLKAHQSSLGLVLVPNIHSGNAELGLIRSNSGATLGVSGSGTSLGFGIVPQFEIADPVAFQLGLFYIPRTYSFGTQKTSMPALQLTPMVRYVPFEFLELGVGPYLSYGMGDIKTSKNGVETSKSYDVQKISKIDYGLALGVGSHIAVSDGMHLIGDVRYHHGIANLSQAGNTTVSSSFKFTSWQFLLGVRFGM